MVDVAIIGGGMVGLSLALALAQEDFSVTVIEPHPPVLDWPDDHYTGRVSALHLGTQRFLDRLKVWSLLRDTCRASLETMTVWDATGGGRIDFDAADIQADALAYIVENREIVRVLWQQCQQHAAVELLSNVKATTIANNTIMLDTHQQIEARLIVGADGANSWLRQQMAVDCIETPYHQDAIVAVIKTEKPHNNTAYQPFLSSGPLGTLPLSDPHQVAIVWSADPVRSTELMNMAIDDFNRELMNALNAELGAMQCLTERRSIPLLGRHAKHYVQAARALVGDAAHTIHPLAGQGANLGFMDAAGLAAVLRDARVHQKDIGDHRVLRRFERQRKSENQIMLWAMESFKAVFASQSPVTVSLRSWGFNLTNRAGWLKQYFSCYATHPDHPQ